MEKTTKMIAEMDYNGVQNAWENTMQALWDNLTDDEKVEIHNHYCEENTQYDDKILNGSELGEELESYRGLAVLSVLNDDFDKDNEFFQKDGYGYWSSSDDADDFLLLDDEYFGHIWGYENGVLKDNEDLFKDGLTDALLDFAKDNNLTASKVYYWVEEELYNEWISEDWEDVAEKFAEYVLTEEEE